MSEQDNTKDSNVPGQLVFDIYLSKMPLLMKCCHKLETFEPMQIDGITLLCASGNSLNRDHKGRLNTCSCQQQSL